MYHYHNLFTIITIPKGETQLYQLYIKVVTLLLRIILRVRVLKSLPFLFYHLAHIVE